MVNLNEPYPIYIGTDLFSSNLFSSHVIDQQVCIVTNEKVAPLYLSTIQKNLEKFQCDAIILPDGEEHKTLATLSLIFDELIIKKHRRNTTLIALGGGVIGDITGFAAACYQRGVNFIQIPTTLLSQVDASVGGKTAVNHPLAKNMIGAFYQPKAVVIDIGTLQSLPEREFYSGLAEIIKAALISDPDLFTWLETNIKNILLRNDLALMHAIREACNIKINIVVADEKDTHTRMLLNLGHTFAHAIEQILGYGVWLHGEAVSVGLVLAADYSYRLGWIEKATLERIKNILTIAKLPITLPNSISVDRLIKVMNTDKKKDAQHLKLVLLKGIGQVVVNSHINLQILEASISENIDQLTRYGEAKCKMF